MAFDPRDPDASLVAIFKYEAVLNAAKSKAEGRPIYDDVERCEIRVPGSKDVKIFPAHERSDWQFDQFTGGQTERTYAQRFRRQYEQFKAHQVQTKTGTPLAHVGFLAEGKILELRALNIYTVEALAHIDGNELKALGYQGRDLKNKAEEYIATAKKGVPSIAAEAELEALRSRTQLLEEDNKTLKDAVTKPSAEFGEMTEEQLKEYIAEATGQRPLGNPSRKTLLRQAMDARPSKQVA